LFLNSFLFPTVNAEHIASTGIYINAAYKFKEKRNIELLWECEI